MMRSLDSALITTNECRCQVQADAEVAGPARQPVHRGHVQPRHQQQEEQVTGIQDVQYLYLGGNKGCQVRLG